MVNMVKVMIKVKFMIKVKGVFEVNAKIGPESRCLPSKPILFGTYVKEIAGQLYACF